uniref:Peptidase S1 domain-containing protein n=1 Tax=Romanomermis culicivorax TaxID=13658 RepID=A0A915JLC9_ROMCU
MYSDFDFQLQYQFNKPKVGYHDEPLFAYDSSNGKYYLLGLSTGVVRQGAKFLDSYKSVWHYLPWIRKVVIEIEERKWKTINKRMPEGTKYQEKGNVDKNEDEQQTKNR